MIEKMENLSNVEVLRKLGISDVITTWYEAKRSRVFGKESDYLSDQDWKMDMIRKAVEDNGTPDKVTYVDISTPQEEIWEMARTEREYDYYKGKAVVLHWGDKREQIS